MKYAIALFALLMFVVGQSLGQTLAPVGGGGFDFWPLVVIAVVGGIGYALFVWHKRNPSQADAAAETAKADILAGWHKATEQVGKLTNLAVKQAEVIASPPVQAAINGPAPAAAPPPPAAVTPAPLFVPAPPVAVAPPVAAPAPAPVAAPAAPDGPAAIQYYDEFGNPDPKGMYQAYQLRAVFAQRAQRDAAVATGPLDLGALESGDKAYLFAMGEYMTFDPRALVRGPFFGAVSAELGKDTFPEMGAARFQTLEFEKTVTPGVVDVVRGLAQGTAAWIPAAFVSWGGPAYIAAHQPAWALGWARVHGAPA